MGGRRFLCAAMAGFAGLLALAPAARASFHDISIREIYPGSLAQPESGYVELQMYLAGQRFVQGHALTIYGSNGGLVGTFAFPGDVPNGANQQTILIGDDGVQGAFGVKPDLVDASFAAVAAGGAACWAGSIDCVSWGSFGGSTPSASGTPADQLGIPNGMALRRTIEPGCPTLLEASDDSADSADDFFDAAPQPRNNASAIVEQACNGPATTIATKPANPTKSTSAAFVYNSASGASFECKLDSAAFAGCDPGGIEYAGPLNEGFHTFQVRAKNEAGTLGATATYTWRIDLTPPTAIIDSHPEDPSAGGSAPFTFHSSETGSSFECSLALGPAADGFSACSSGQTYMNLADGEYTFKVQATDAAGNPGAVTAFEWTVDNDLVDKTPPDTLIDSKPLNPSSSADASFTYHSTELGSSFECKLDGALFSACAAAGTTYPGLANGSHTFQVRAIDASENIDLSPAGYTFDVAVQSSLTPTPPTPLMASSGEGFLGLPVAKSRSGKRHFHKRCRRGKHRPHKRCHRRKPKSHSSATASTFHLVMLREIYPGSGANPDAEYVELQMYASGQDLVHGHRVEFFDASGTSLGTVTFDSDVPKGANQSTILAATSAAESQFGIAADKGMPAGRLDPAGGAVCWEALDCAAWGNFHGSANTATGSPADPLGIPDGMALRRTIAAGCPTLLEDADDHDDSATDFADVFPAPRPNSVAPAERSCSQANGAGDYGPAAGGDGQGERRPQTKIRRGPSGMTSDRTPTFRFGSSLARSTFLCKLDNHSFHRCHSPFTTPQLSLGRHVFRVKARAPGGAVDRSPAIRRFTVTP